MYTYRDLLPLHYSPPQNLCLKVMGIWTKAALIRSSDLYTSKTGKYVSGTHMKLMRVRIALCGNHACYVSHVKMYTRS